MKVIQKVFRRKARKNKDLSFWEHVDILKKYLFTYLFVVLSLSGVAYFFNEILLDVLMMPLEGAKLIFLSPIDSVTFLFKIDFLLGVILSIPFLLILFWKFISPALSRKQGIILALFLFISLFLSVISVLYTYFYLIKLTIGFLLSINAGAIENSFTAQNYLNFIIFQIFFMAFVFQIPLIIVLLKYFNICQPEVIGAKRRYVYLALIIIVSFITPTTDIFSLLIVLVPIYFLFEVGLIVAKIIPFKWKSLKRFFSFEYYKIKFKL